MANTGAPAVFGAPRLRAARRRGVGVGDQEVVKALPAQRPYEPLRDRVRPRCSYRRADDPDVGAGEDGVERRRELAVPVADQEPELVDALAEVQE
jgi:hypothetical protein